MRALLAVGVVAIHATRANESFGDALYIDGAAFRGRLGLNTQRAATRLFQAVVAEAPPVPVPQKFHAADFPGDDVRWAPMADGAQRSSARALAEHGRLVLELWNACKAQWRPARSRLRVQRHLDGVVRDFTRRCKRIEQATQCDAPVAAAAGSSEFAPGKRHDPRAVELLRIKLGLLQYLKIFIVATNGFSEDGLGAESAESIDGLHHFVWRARVDRQRLGLFDDGGAADPPQLAPLVQDGLFSGEECSDAVQGLESAVKGEQGEISVDVSDVMATVKGDQAPSWLHKLMHMRRVAREVAERHFNKTLYHELTEFTVRPAGRAAGQRWHADNCDFVLLPGDAELCVPNESHEAPWITHSALLYLTGLDQGVEGGLLRQSGGAPNSIVAPQCGRIVTFAGGAEHAHAVSRIGAGRRWSIALWFSESVVMQREAFVYSDGVVRRDPVPGDRAYRQPKLMSGLDARGGSSNEIWHHHWHMDLLRNTLTEAFVPVWGEAEDEDDERNPDADD